MTDTNSNIKREETDATLSRYIEENEHLFVVLGIFAAISIYLSNFTEEINSSDEFNYLYLGIVASFSLTALLALVALQNAIETYKSGTPLSEKILNLDGIIFITFLVSFYVLLTVIAGLVLEYPRPLTLLLVFIVGFSAIQTFSRVNELVATQLELWLDFLPQRQIQALTSVLLFIAALLFIRNQSELFDFSMFAAIPGQPLEWEQALEILALEWAYVYLVFEGIRVFHVIGSTVRVVLTSFWLAMLVVYWGIKDYVFGK